MLIYSLNNKLEYIEEFALLCHKEWGRFWSNDIFKEQLQSRIDNTLKRLEKFPTLILLDNDILIGFISLFENDCVDRRDLSPWYATLYVKVEYRGKGYSKILNDAIIKEARRLNYEKLYLKTELIDFYEKYGFKYLEKMSNGESIYYKNLK